MARNQGPVTFAKRQRERMKQMERQEKLARKLERNARKRAAKRARDVQVPVSTAVPAPEPTTQDQVVEGKDRVVPTGSSVTERAASVST